MHFLLYQGFISALWLLSCFTLSVQAVNGDGSDLYGLNKYFCLHNPNYNVKAKTDPYETGNTLGVTFKDLHYVYMLSNENSPDDLIYGGMALANVPYRYVIFSSNGTTVDQELFFRNATNSTAYDVFNRASVELHPEAVEYIKVSFTYPGSDSEVKYTNKLNRTVVHPFNQVYTIHVHTDEDDLAAMNADVLSNVTIPVNFTRITPENVKKYTGATLKIDGITQRLWKKLSYKLDLPEDQSINGFRRFKLRSLSSDPSFMRERIYYDMLSVAYLPGAKGSYVRLFINKIPQGLYLLTDRYESPFLENIFNTTTIGSDSSNENSNAEDHDSGWNYYKHKKALQKSSLNKRYYHHSNEGYFDELIGGAKSIRGGLIYGQVQDIHFNNTDIDGSTLKYLGMQHSVYITENSTNLYEVVQESSEGSVMDALIAFMSFIKSTESITLPNPVVEQEDIEAEERLIAQWEAYFDVSIFLKNVALELILSNTEGYCQTASNYFLYQDLAQDGRFIYMPYNVNLILGSTLYPAKNGTTPFDFFDRYGSFDQLDSRPLLKQILAVPTYNDRFNIILRDYYQALFNTTAAGNYLVYIKALITDDAGWDRALFRFRPDNFVGREDFYQELVNEHIYQYPLGRDFMLRQDIVPFEQAVRGPIRDTPSLIGIYEQFNNTMIRIEEYVQYLASNTVSDYTELYMGS